MKSIKTLFVVVSLAASSFAMAEGGGDRTFARMEQNRQASLETYHASRQQSESSPVANSEVNSPNHSSC
jgi:outer membrane lipoprotein-sorting protein